MGVHPWPGIDPASAYMTMTGGAWAAPMHAAGAALDALGAQVEMTVAASAVNASATAANWTGSGAAASAASGAELGADQSVYSMLSLLKSEILHSAGELHTTTVPQMVTHIQADANRGEWGVDNAINPWVLGMLTPRLIDLDTEYFGFMWPNNASAGLRYGAGLDALGAALSGLSALPSLAGGSVAAPAMAAADVASNAGMSMMSAVMSATEQAATSAISPATSGASQAGSPVSQSQLSASNPSTSTSGISPMAAVQSRGPVSPSLAQSQPPAMGMFAPPAAAAALTPSAPSPVMPVSPPVQTMTPSAAPGVTSFAKPAEPFSPPPPPSGGKAAGLKPGMLNASALRGPVGTTPASTALLTKPLTTASSLATQPLAYVSPTVPPSQPSLPSQPNLEPGAIQTLQPPPTPPQTPPPPAQMPPAVPQNSAPATLSGPTGSGGQGTGAQMLGNGPAGAPQAPPAFPPPPLDPAPPIPQPPIPPPSPGEPPLSSPAIPSWVTPPVSKSVEALQKAYKDLSDAINNHNSWRPDPKNPTAVENYNREAWTYNTWKAQIEARLGSENVQYTPVKKAVSTDDRYWWTQPAPEQSLHQGSLTQTPDEIRLSQESVIDKLWRYLLDREHDVGGPKADWFERALGFTRQNLADLAKQIVFDPNKAWETGVTQFGTKYNEIISVTGANGKTIEILTGWIRGSDGIVKLVTAVPASR